MDIKTDRDTVTAFALGVLVCAVLLSPLWLFGGGISTEEAADIVVEKIYSDVGKENHIVEVIAAEKVGGGLYRVDASVREISAAENVTYLVTKDGKIILDESEKIEAEQDKTGGSEKTGPSDSSGRTVDGVHVRGPEDAKVTIIEYSDYECPFCKRFYDDAYKQILATYPDDVKIIFKDFPLSFHAQATSAAEAAECAGAQGKYWEYHDKLFENQGDWSAAGRPSFNKYAEDLGLDMDSFNNCVDNREFKANVEADFREGQAKGVRGTPAFFINDKLVSGAQPFATFKTEIDAALAAAG